MRLALISRTFEGAAAIVVSATLLALAAAPPKREQTSVGITALPPATYASFFGQQRQMIADSLQWQIRLAEWQPLAWPPEQFKFELRNEESKAVSQFTLHAWRPPSQALQVNQIDEIDIFGDRLLILGRAGASSTEADVVDLPSGRILDRFSCFMPVVSPDHRFVAFLKSFPGHPGPVSVTAEYLVYSLAQGSAFNRPHFKPDILTDAGWAVYPPGATNAPGSNLVPGLDSPVHWISSGRLFWLDAHTMAFTDRYPAENRLVVVDLSKEVQAPVVRTKLLNTSGLIDLQRCRNNYSPEDLKNISADPSGLIRVQQISPAPETPGYVRLRFDPSPCLTRTELTLELP